MLYSSADIYISRGLVMRVCRLSIRQHLPIAYQSHDNTTHVLAVPSFEINPNSILHISLFADFL